MPLNKIFRQDAKGFYTIPATYDAVKRSNYGKSQTLRIMKGKLQVAVFVLGIAGK